MAHIVKLHSITIAFSSKISVENLNISNSVLNGGFVLQMVILLFQTGVRNISNWGLKIRLEVSGRLHFKALNLGFKV